MSTAQKLREEGRQEARIAGQIEGKAWGLQVALRSKFGELPEPWLSRVQRADADHLHRWLERAFTAQSLDDVFAD